MSLDSGFSLHSKMASLLEATDMDGGPSNTSRIFTLSPEALKALSGSGVIEPFEVNHVRLPRALKDRYLATGYVLLCIAEPRSACQIQVGSDVQTELVSNP